MNKKILIGIVATVTLLISSVIAIASGFGLFTATSHFNVEEGVEVQYWDGATWQNLAVDGGSFDLGTATIKPGETNTFRIQARNTATSGALDLELNIEAVTGLSYDVLCVSGQSEGLNYTKSANVFNFKSVGGVTWKAMDITTTANGDISVGGVEFDNVLSRGNALSSYDLTC